MARRLRLAHCVSAVVSLGACAIPGAASAVTVGMPDLNPATGFGLQCSGGAGAMCSFVPQNPVVAAPFDGLITRWRIRTLGGSGSAQLRVLRPSPTAGAPATWLTSAGNQSVEPGIHAFEEHIPVRQGDHIGVTVQDVVVLAQDAMGPFISIWNPPAADGASPPPTGSLNNAVLGVNADVERDNDGDGLGDETQDSDDDNDGAADVSDNCPTTAGVSQADTDGDGAGDLCDADDDNDGLPDGTETALGSNPSIPDTDGDGSPDGSDRCLLLAGPGGCPGAAVLAIKAPARLKRRAFTGGVRVTITPDQAVALRLWLVAPGRGKGTILAERSLPVAAGVRTVRLKPSRKAAKGVKRVQLRVLAINPAGAQTEVRRTLRVTR